MLGRKARSAPSSTTPAIAPRSSPAPKLLQKVANPKSLSKAPLELPQGQTIDRTQILQRAQAAGLRSVPLVLAPGECSVRGDVVDLFPLGADAAVRLEFFDRTLESIRTFDAGSQRTSRSPRRGCLHPVLIHVPYGDHPCERTQGDRMTNKPTWSTPFGVFGHGSSWPDQYTNPRRRQTGRSFRFPTLWRVWSANSPRFPKPWLRDRVEDNGARPSRGFHLRTFCPTISTVTELGPPPGVLNRFRPQGERTLRDLGSDELALELLHRVRANNLPDLVLAGLLGIEIDRHANRHLNRYGTQYLRDLFHRLAMFPGRPTDLQGKTFVNLGCGSHHPLGLPTVFLLLGARRAISVDLDPPQEVAAGLFAVARTAAAMLLDSRLLEPRH